LTWDAGVLVVGLSTIAAFIAAFHVSGLVARARAAVTVASQAMAVIVEKTLDDEVKERLVQRAAIRLFGQFALITLTAIMVLAVPGVVMWVGDVMGLAPFTAASDFLLSWQVLIGASVVMLAAVWLVRRR